MGPGGQLWKERAPNAPSLPGFLPPTSLAPLVKAVRPGVVNIATRNEGTSRSLGSGFVINPDGLVVTNNHVVERAQQHPRAPGRRAGVRSAWWSAATPATDLALLRLPDAKELPTVTLGDSDQLEIGDWVVAIGNPFGLDMSVTHGLISARERVIGVGAFDDFIQTNALINPGNSGGPLFDMHGDVVGVTTAITSQGQGIGFAVPINLVKDLLPNLLEQRPARARLAGAQRAGSGGGRRARPSGGRRLRRQPRREGRPAPRAIAWWAVGGKPVQRYQQVLRRVALLQPGTAVKVEVIRGGRTFEFTATLAQRPSHRGAPGHELGRPHRCPGPRAPGRSIRTRRPRWAWSRGCASKRSSPAAPPSWRGWPWAT